MDFGECTVFDGPFDETRATIECDTPVASLAGRNIRGRFWYMNATLYGLTTSGLPTVTPEPTVTVTPEPTWAAPTSTATAVATVTPTSTPEDVQIIFDDCVYTCKCYREER